MHTQLAAGCIVHVLLSVVSVAKCSGCTGRMTATESLPDTMPCLNCGCAVQVSQSAGKRDLEVAAVEHLLLDSREKRLAQSKRRLKTDLARLCTALKACSEQLRAQPADGLIVPGVDPRPRISGTELHKAAHLVRQHRDTLEACAPTAVFNNDDRAAVAVALTELEAVVQQLAERPAAVMAEGLAARTDALQALLKQLPLPPPSLVSASEKELKDMLVQTARLVCSHVTLPAPVIQSAAGNDTSHRAYSVRR